MKLIFYEGRGKVEKRKRGGEKKQVNQMVTQKKKISMGVGFRRSVRWKRKLVAKACPHFR